ncbi:MAG: hypothetical protein HS129_14755 [Leptospiraceae bacterium]|nr:hypothetical protein [Leptospiraceae bacterium]
MSIINRDVFLLSPKKPLFDWSNKIFPDDPIKFDRKPFDHDEAHAYLIPELDSPKDFKKWIQKNYRQFFEEQLFGWCTDETLWPRKLTFKMFQDWFDISYQSMVFDTIPDEPVEYD